MIDLAPYRAKGFPGRFDASIANTAVTGIDADQAKAMIRVCPETELYLYDGPFSPRTIRYVRGARPELEAVVAPFNHGSPRERAIAAMGWVYAHIAHPHHVGPTPTDRALAEEGIIASGVGWCNEQTRVFIALCEVMEVPARLCFVFHANGRCSHAPAEAYVDGRWAYFDPTFNVCATLADGCLAEGRELSGPHRDLAHAVYRPALLAYYDRLHPWVPTLPAWTEADRPHPDRGGDLLTALGITNYLIEGVEAVSAD